MKLAILIPTLTNRKVFYDRCVNALEIQIRRLVSPSDVKIITFCDDGENTTGAKRNWLYNKAREDGAIYGASFDCDDLPGENYILRQMEVVESGMDCGSLWGQLYTHGVIGNKFHHSIKYDSYTQDDKFYYRNVNHLNCVKLNLVKDIPFRNITIGEDGNWSIDVHSAKVLKTEYQINEVIYHYFTGKKLTPIEWEIYEKLIQIT